MKNACKRQSRLQVTPIPTLYESICEQGIDAGLNFVGAVPEYKTVKPIMYRARNKELQVPKTRFRSRSEVIIPSRYSTDFLLFDTGMEHEDRIIAFSTMKSREILTTLSIFICDGTYRSCYRRFYQLYCIHGDLRSTRYYTNIIPLIYVLMPNKRENTYERMFRLLKQNLPKWNPNRFIVDFELAPIKAIRSVFTNIHLQGCNFHFKQALYKKADSLGITIDTEAKHHIALCAALAYLKDELVEAGWAVIEDMTPSNEKYTEFNNYFVSYWIRSDFRGVWNCYRARHRTTNGAESWHKRLNNKMPKKKPELLQFLDVLRSEGRHFDRRIQEIDKEIVNRKPSVIEMDDKIAAIVDDYEQSRLTMTEAILRLSTCVHNNQG